MIGHQMTAALRAVLALAHRRLLERRNMLRPRRDPYRFRLPQGERVYRPAGPRTAGTAMAITHPFRRTRDLDFDRSAKTASGMFHDSSVSLQTIEKVVRLIWARETASKPAPGNGDIRRRTCRRDHAPPAQCRRRCRPWS